MSIVFRIATDADNHQGPVAVITARQLAAFRAFLRAESIRTNTVLLAPEAADDAFLSYSFEARVCPLALASVTRVRSEEHTSELQSLMRISYAVFCLKKKTKYTTDKTRYVNIALYALVEN